MIEAIDRSQARISKMFEDRKISFASECESKDGKRLAEPVNEEEKPVLEPELMETIEEKTMEEEVTKISEQEVFDEMTKATMEEIGADLDVEAQPNRHIVLGGTHSPPDLGFSRHRDNAGSALAISPTEPFVLSGGKDKSVVFDPGIKKLIGVLGISIDTPTPKYLFIPQDILVDNNLNSITSVDGFSLFRATRIFNGHWINMNICSFNYPHYGMKCARFSVFFEKTTVLSNFFPRDVITFSRYAFKDITFSDRAWATMFAGVIELCGKKCYFSMKIMNVVSLYSCEKLLLSQTETEILQFLGHSFFLTWYTNLGMDKFSGFAMEIYPCGDLHTQQIQLAKHFFEQAGMVGTLCALFGVFPLFVNSICGEKSNVAFLDKQSINYTLCFTLHSCTPFLVYGLDFCWYQMGASMETRPIPWVTNIFVLSKIRGSLCSYETLEKWMTGSYAGHSSVCFRNLVGNLWVVESWHENEGVEVVIAILTWDEWLEYEETKDDGNPPIVFLPVYPDLQAKFNKYDVWGYANDMLGLPYDYHNLILSRIVPMSGNYPSPLDANLVAYVMTACTQMALAYAGNIWNETLNKLLGTKNPSLSEVIVEVERRGSFFGQMLATPELDGIVYADGKSISCIAFAFELYKEAFLFGEIENSVQVTDFTIKDAYSLNFHENNSSCLSLWCNDGNLDPWVSSLELELTEYSREEILSRNIRYFHGPATHPATVKNIREAIDGRTGVTVLLINYTKSGKNLWMLFHRQLVCDLLWSDPEDIVGEWGLNLCGAGLLFGDFNGALYDSDGDPRSNLNVMSNIPGEIIWGNHIKKRKHKQFKDGSQFKNGSLCWRIKVHGMDGLSSQGISHA